MNKLSDILIRIVELIRILKSCCFIRSLSLFQSLISFRNNRNNIKRQTVDRGTSDVKSEDRSKVQLSIGPIAF